MKQLVFKSSKSQMKIQEMIFMILGLFFFLMLVFLAYIAFSTANLKDIAQAKYRDDAVLLAAGLAGSPELSCPDNIGIGSFVCVDADKAIVLANRQEYSKFWDVNSFRIEKIYPVSERPIICTTDNYPNCNNIVIVKNKTSMKEDYSTFVSLCRIENSENNFYNKCELGRILITPKIVK